MRLLLCLAASLVLSQAARLPRGLVRSAFPNFHAIHHGHGATSYQNVQVENYGSVPISTEHHYVQEEKHHVIHVEQPHYVHHEDHLEGPIVNLVPIVDSKHHLQDVILVEKVPYVKSEIQHINLHEPTQLHYYVDNYERGPEYEYH